MTTVAPPNLTTATHEFGLRADRPKSYKMDGIVGNTAHLEKACESGTYHISAQDCCSKYGHLYSLDTAEDIAGGKAHPTWASAWDLAFNAADMILVTTRLVTAAKAGDPRLKAAVAEFAGTTNGKTVHAFYVNTGKDDPNNTGGWDSGHLTHVHISWRRDQCNNYEAIKAVMDLICGIPLEQELVMDAEVKAAFDAVNKEIAKVSTQVNSVSWGLGNDTDGDGKPNMRDSVQNIVDQALAKALKPLFDHFGIKQ